MKVQKRGVMSNDEDRETAITNGATGIGMIYGAACSGIATFAYIAATGNRSALVLSFAETAIACFGVVKSFRADQELAKGNAKPSGRGGPGG